MSWGILGSIGNGIKSAGRGLLGGIDNAAMNSLTGGGLLNDALAGQPGAPQIDKRQLRGSYLMNLGGALQQGRPLGEGVQQFQAQNIAQIQAAQQVQQQRARQQAMAGLQQKLAGAKDPQQFQSALMEALPVIGAEGVKQMAEAYKAGAPTPKTHVGSRTAMGPDGKPVQVDSWSDGSETISAYGVLPKLSRVDQGGTVQQYDDNTGQPFGAAIAKTATPGELLADERGKMEFGKPQHVVVPGQGMFTWNPNDPGKAQPVTGPNGQRITAPTGDGTGGNRAFQNSTELRREFNTIAQPYATIAQAHSKIMEASRNPSAAGDVSLIYGYMKLLDPGSTVRESEFATAQNAGSIPERVRAAFNKAKEGTRLTDAIRADFVGQANNIVGAIKPQLDAHIQRYSGIARQNGLDAGQVVFNPFAQAQQGAQPQQQMPWQVRR